MKYIRKADKSDCKLIHELATKVFPETYKDILNPIQIDYMMKWMYSIESLKEQMNSDHIYFIVYSDNDNPLGYVSINKEGDDIWHLQKIYVLPNLQGEGVGNLLFNYCIDFIKNDEEGNPFKIQLNVNRNNKALVFYIRKVLKTNP